MKNTIKLFSIASGFLVAFVFIAPSSYATVDNGGLSGGCNTITDCGLTQDFYNGQCRDHIGIVGDCNIGGWTNYNFSCTSGCSGSCGTGEIRCGSACVAPQVDDGDPDGVNDGLNCANAGYGFDQCTGQCTSCTGGYTVVDGKCLKPLEVVDDMIDARGVGNSAYKIWDGVDLTEVVHITNAGCTDNQIAVSDSAESTGWKCEDKPSAPITLEDYVGGVVDFLSVLMTELGVDNTIKTNIVNALEALADGTDAGELVTLTVALAAFAIPADSPLPVEGYFGVYAGSTSSAYNGNQGGYTSANAYCNVNYAGSHICTAVEMINSYNNIPGPITGLAESVWVNNGPPGYISNVTNDCNGWQSNSTTVFGYVWDGATDKSLVTPCNLTRKFACCM
ncbi:MAG TPA: hypothetical protein ENK70_06230 [Methylophaga sp.]|nr:hypothetical protein [Methylophaga sp.]